MKFNSIVFPALSLLAAAEAAKLTIVAYTDSVASIYVDGYDVGTINAQTDFTGDALTNYNANGKRFDVEVGGGDHQIAVIARNVNGEDATFLAAVSVDGFSKGATGSAGWKAQSQSLSFVPPNRAWSRLTFDDSSWSSLPTNTFCDTRTFNTAGKTVWFDGKCSTSGGSAETMLVRYKVSVPVFNVPNPTTEQGANAKGSFGTAIALANKPSCDVIVQVANDGNRTKVDKCQLTFTPENWATLQTVNTDLLFQNIKFNSPFETQLTLSSFLLVIMILDCMALQRLPN